ncbi:hypothetical protein CATMIT_01757, partial [Catenibacterium mitsuokai DSM 15897]
VVIEAADVEGRGAAEELERILRADLQRGQLLRLVGLRNHVDVEAVVEAAGLVAGGDGRVEQIARGQVVFETQPPVGELERAGAVLRRRHAQHDEAVLAVGRAVDRVAADVGTVDTGAVRAAAVDDSGQLLLHRVARASAQDALQQEAGEVGVAGEAGDVEAGPVEQRRHEAIGAQAGLEHAAVAAQAERPVAADAIARLALLGVAQTALDPEMLVDVERAVAVHRPRTSVHIGHGELGARIERALVGQRQEADLLLLVKIEAAGGPAETRVVVRRQPKLVGLRLRARLQVVGAEVVVVHAAPARRLARGTRAQVAARPAVAVGSGVDLEIIDVAIAAAVLQVDAAEVVAHLA